MEMTPRLELSPDPNAFYPEPAKLTADQQPLFVRSVSPMVVPESKKSDTFEVLPAIQHVELKFFEDGYTLLNLRCNFLEEVMASSE